MRSRRVVALGFVLGIALATAIGLWLGGGCAKIIKKRPPVVLNVGSIYRPTVDPDENWNFLGRVTVPTRPVGVWGDVVYNVGRSEIQSTSFGLIFVFPTEAGTEILLEEEDPTGVHQLPPP